MYRIKLEMYLIVLGAFVLAMSLFVIIHDNNEDIEIPAGIGLLGGLAIIVTSILMLTGRSGNGNGGVHRRSDCDCRPDSRR